MKRRLAAIAAALLCSHLACMAQPPATTRASEGYLEHAQSVAGQSELSPQAWKEKLEALPLPSHTVEGYGGGAITPVAYLVNRGPKGTVVGKPAVSVMSVVAGKKNVQAFAVTETLLRRIELGYALDYVGLGSLPDDIQDTTGIDIERHHLWIHNFNVRVMLLDEGAFGVVYLPALTAGVHFKFNEGIEDIDNSVHGALTEIGYDRPYGTDFTLTASKTIVHRLTFNRPLTLTVGMRNSQAAQIGALGFSDHCQTTVEANVAYLLTDFLVVGYEFRQKGSPYDEIPGLIGPEDNWHAVGVAWLVNSHFTIDFGWAALGTVANSVEDCAMWLQIKYEF